MKKQSDVTYAKNMVAEYTEQKGRKVSLKTPDDKTVE